MITQDELEMFVDGCIEPLYAPEENQCSGDACPIVFDNDSE